MWLKDGHLILYFTDNHLVKLLWYVVLFVGRHVSAWTRLDEIVFKTMFIFKQNVYKICFNFLQDYN